MSELLQIPDCESCGAAVIYSPAHNGLYCAFCNNVQEISASGEYEGTFSHEEIKTGRFENRERKLEYVESCRNCGAKVEVKLNQTGFECATCHTNEVYPSFLERKAEEFATIIPFRISRSKALSIFGKWIGNRRLLDPGGLRKDNRVTKVEGLYIPAWMLNFEMSTLWRVKAGESSGEDDTLSWTFHMGRFKWDFKGTTWISSLRYKHSMLKVLRPYDYADSVRFNIRYLLGFAVDFHQQRFQKIERLVLKELEEDCRKVVKGKLNADEYEDWELKMAIRDLRGSLALVPVWVITYKHKDGEDYLLINGQTGKFFGRRPEILKVWILGIVVLILLFLGLILGIIVNR